MGKKPQAAPAVEMVVTPAAQELNVSSTETERTYIWADGFSIRIVDPTVVTIAEDNSHSVLDKGGKAWDVGNTWRVVSSIPKSVVTVQ